MAGGYVQPAPDPISTLLQKFDNLTGRVEELERPTGSQLSATVTELKQRSAFSKVGSYSNTYSASFSSTLTDATVSIDLDASRQVLCIASIGWNPSYPSGSGARFVTGSAFVIVDGINYAVGGGGFGSITLSGTVAFSGGTSQTLISIQPLTLGAGVHLIACGVSGSVAGSMSAQLAGPTISAFVLGKV